MPPPRSGWAAHGPGVAWLALALGSGELVWWPQLIAKYGLTFLWLLVPACLLPFPLAVAIGRYTLLTGEGVPRGLQRVHPLLGAVTVALLLVVVLSLGTLASAGGAALAALTQAPGGFTVRGRTLLWSYAALALLVAAVAFSGTVWRTVERLTKGVVLLTILGLLWACAQTEVRSAVPAFVAALAGPPGPSERAWDVNDSTMLVIAVALVGLGGLRPLLYSYWIRGAGNGMATGADRTTGVLAGAAVGDAVGGYLVDDAPASAAAWRRWRHWLRVDVLIAVGGNLVATLCACAVAYALTYRRGIVPAEYDVAALQTVLVDVDWGASGRRVFLVGTAALLAGAWLTIADGLSRMCAELFVGGDARARGARANAPYYLVLGTSTAVTCVTVWLEAPALAAHLATAVAVAGTALLPPALYVLDHRRLARAVPSWARAHAGERILLALSAVVYALLAVAYAWATWPWW